MVETYFISIEKKTMTCFYLYQFIINITNKLIIIYTNKSFNCYSIKLNKFLMRLAFVIVYLFFLINKLEASIKPGNKKIYIYIKD